MGISVETLAVAKKYTNKSIEGITGSLAGKNATIESITDITGGHRVTFKWTADNGDVRTQTMDVMDGAKGDKGETGDAGLGIKAVNINAQSHLIITYDNDSTYDAGELPGGSGEVISVNGKKGVVTLDANDVGALPDDTELFSGDYNDLDNLPDLTNFITNTVDNLVNYYKKTETYTKTEVDNIANTIKNGRFEVVATLPTTDIKTNVIYLVPKSTTQTSNIKDEYINLDGTSAGWEKVGDTEIDLSGYVTTTALNTALAAYTTTTDLTTLLADKVDKVTGKGLSTNDYTNTDKELVDSIPNLAPISLVKDTVGWTGKNLLKINMLRSPYTYNGITFTKNSDGSISVSGTSTSVMGINIAYFDVESNVKYILTGTPDDIVNPTNNYIRAHREETTYIWQVQDNGNGAVIQRTNSERIWFDIRIDSGVTINTTFYPMLRKANITDPTYEPYHESVEVMYEEEIHGVNLFDDSKIEVGKAWNGDTNANRARNIIPCEPNSEYIVSMNGTNGLDSVFFSVSENIPPASQTAITSFPYTIRTGISDRYITLGFNKTNIALSDVTSLKIMLRKADIEDSTYRPYNEQAIQNQLNAQGVLGAKNLLKNNATSQTINNVAFTVNSDDKTVNVTRTAEQTEIVTRDLYVVSDEDYKLLAGKTLLMTGCPSGGSNDTYYLECYYNDGTGHWLRDIGNGLKITLPATKPTTIKFLIGIKVASVIPSGGLTFKPMIRLASDPDDTYQSYAMTNKKLTEKVNALPREVFVTTDTRVTTTNDANTLPCGFTRMNDANSNLPTDGTGGNVWYDILTVRQSNDSSKETWGYGFQLAVQTTTNANMGDTYVRAVNGGATPTWGEWKKLN